MWMTLLYVLLDKGKNYAMDKLEDRCWKVLLNKKKDQVVDQLVDDAIELLFNKNKDQVVDNMWMTLCSIRVS